MSLLVLYLRIPVPFLWVPLTDTPSLIIDMSDIFLELERFGY